MKKSGTLVVMILLLAATPVLADAPGLISYQTKLVDGSGQPITTDTRLRFRLFQGGDATTFPSTGLLVYHEVVMVTPSADGIVSHMIGTGTKGTNCPEITCELTASDFPDGSIPVWLEITIDPNGVQFDGDDDVLLPRTRFGAVGYAMHADSLDGKDSTEFIDISPTTQNKNGTLVVGDLNCTDCLTASDIATGGVASAEVLDDSLTASDLAANSVTASEIATGAVGSAEVQDNSLTASDLAADSVTASEIATGAVASAEVADNSLTASDLATDSVGASEIAAGAVGASEVADGSLTTIDIMDNSLGAADLAANSVGTSELQDNSVTGGKLNLTMWESADISTSSTTELPTLLGAYDVCFLSNITIRNYYNTGTNTWCRLWKSGSNWYLGVRGNNTTTLSCRAMCF